VILALALALQSALPTKQVVAPPSDILAGILRLPDPASTPSFSRAWIQPVRFAGQRAALALPVEADGPLAFALLSPGASELSLHAAGVVLQTRVLPAGEELPGWVVLACSAANVHAGDLALEIEAPAARTPQECWLLSRGASALELEAWVDTQELVSDGPVGIAARLAHAGDSVVVERATLLVDGEGLQARVELAPGEPRRALVPAGWSGDLRARVEFEGRLAGGERFARSVQLAFPVLQRRTLFDGRVRVDGERIVLGALPLAPPSRLHVSTELWGTDSSGRLVPVCWLSRMLEPEVREGLWDLPLEIDPAWAERAQAGAPFELREARVQDPDSEVVFDRLAQLRVAGTLPHSLAAPSNPYALAHPKVLHPALMLVHGYCSSGSIWPAPDFMQPKLEFLDPNANRSHDQFAQRIAAQAQAAGLTSFGVVAHSQGGCAALHLLTYYTSGLDYATGARRIQSVASPYQGTPLASLGFFACGVNIDMTPSGSATWLAGIPSAARAQVSYWTTSNAGSACNALTDFFLTNPEDGVVEEYRGQLPGGVNMGHTTGWCHTTGMSNPACYTDHVRNQGMDSAAAR
jgi:pimeloyl-ACP methyl ester carboxylesterase